MASEASNDVEMSDVAPANEEYFDADYKHGLCDKMYELFESGECTDITLVTAVDQTRIQAHRVILSAASPYFKVLLYGPMQEADQDVITIEQISGRTLQALIRFCYIGKIAITSDNVDELLAAASYLVIVCVEKLCEKFCRMTLSRENCLGLWLLADQYNFDELKNDAYAMVMDSFPHLVNGEEFRHLKKEGLQKLLADDNIFVYSEEDVFEALITWIQFDEAGRKGHFAELVALVRLNQMTDSFVYRVLMKHCSNWASHELHVELASAHQNSDDDQSNRNNLRSSLIGPIPMLVGTDAHKSDDQFTIEKISQLKMDLFEVLSFPGYRRGHSSVQAGEYMYVLGGKGVAGHALNKVQRVNLRHWTVEEVKPMAIQRAHFPSVYLNGCIYAIGGNFDSSTSKNVILSVERYNIAKAEWSEVTPLNVNRENPRQIQAIAFNGHIVVVYPGGMSCYDPVFDEWLKKSPLPQTGTKFDVYIVDNQLKAALYVPGESNFQRYTYDASSNQWGDELEYAFSWKPPALFYHRGHDGILFCYQLRFHKNRSLRCCQYSRKADISLTFDSETCFSAGERQRLSNFFQLVAPGRFLSAPNE